MVGRSVIGLKVFKGTTYGPAKYLSKGAQRFRKMTQEEMDKYDRKVTRTKGYDVDGCTGSMPGRILPIIPSTHKNSEWEIATAVAQVAIAKYSMEEEKDVYFESLEKANSQPVQGTMYYLTIKGKDMADGETKLYRAKVLYGIPRKVDLLEFKEFKPPTKKKPVTHRKAKGSTSSNGNKRSKAEKRTRVLAGGARGGGAVLTAFTALLQKIKSENPSVTHAMARDAASEKWKSMLDAEKQSFMPKI